MAKHSGLFTADLRGLDLGDDVLERIDAGIKKLVESEIGHVVSAHGARFIPPDGPSGIAIVARQIRGAK